MKTKDISGYEGIYAVTDDGRIWSYHKKDYKEIQEFLKTKYKCVTLFKDGKGKTCSVHRLVAEAFIPNPENKPCVGHKDCNKDNNNVENLYWCTQQENMNNPLTHQNISSSRKGIKFSEEHRKHLSEKAKINNVKRDKKKKGQFIN